MRCFDARSRLIRPGGTFAVCDDFQRATGDARARRMVDRVRRGWHVNTLIASDELVALATAAGFEHLSTDDLSPWPEIGRARDRAIDVLVACVGWLPLKGTRIGHLAGGRALQACLAQGWIGYDLALFRLPVPHTDPLLLGSGRDASSIR